jgi:cytoskeletal protein RodZ
MTIEGLGKKFQEARLARNLTLDEAARMTKIRPARLAEIEADDFSQFPASHTQKVFFLSTANF